MKTEEINNLTRTPDLGIITVPTFNVPTPAPTPTTSFWDSFNKISSTILNVGNQAIDTVQNLKNNTPTLQTQQQLQLQQQQLQQQQQKGSVLKYVAIAVGVLAAGGVTYALLKGKKKKSLSGHTQETIDVPHTDLGDLNTAKTKAGKDKQRKAVFARLAAEGSSKPKAKKAKAKKVRI